MTTSAARAPVALYLHVPFCISLCPYCDFVVYTGRAARGPVDRIAAFTAALRMELELRADEADLRFGPTGPSRAPLRSVYLGGGTPSLLPARDVDALLDHVERRFGLAPDVEITLEANPGRDERGDLAGFRAAGVTRLSLGAQSLHDEELHAIGRRHRAADVAVAVEEARSAGFASVSLDLLYDLPGQTVDAWRQTLGAALDLAPDHVSAYALTLDDPDAEGLTGPTGDHLPVRPGARAWRLRTTALQDDERAAEMDALAGDLLAAAGIQRYEIANHARAGHESRHNLAYWRRQPYEALGPGAHAFDGDRVRRWNAARLDGYLGALLASGETSPQLPPGGHEVLDAATARAERVILGLRLREGIGPELGRDPDVARTMLWARRLGLIGKEGGRHRLTDQGRMLSNELFRRLLPEQGPGAVDGEERIVSERVSAA